MQKITPFLWFDGKAEEAMNFYTGIFKKSVVKDVRRYGEGMPLPAGTVMSATFELEGMEFIGLNAGPMFSFTPAVSFFIKCADQAEVDYFWDHLTADGGEEQPCGWLKDKFGLSWQVIPDALGRLMADKDPQRAMRAAQAMMQMKKIDVAKLEVAANG